MEAVAAGCLPLVPNRLAYRELIGEQYRYESLVSSPEKEAVVAVDTLLKLILKDKGNDNLREQFKQYSWASLTGRYQKAIDQLYPPHRV